MKDRMFWKVIGVSVVLGLFSIGYGLCKSNQMSPPSLSSAAYGDDAAPGEPRLDFKGVPSLPESYNRFQSVCRAKVPGGWLVIVRHTMKSEAFSITFYPDPKHEWQGGSLK